jgi:hypothetical protein
MVPASRPHPRDRSKCIFEFFENWKHYGRTIAGVATQRKVLAVDEFNMPREEYLTLIEIGFGGKNAFDEAAHKIKKQFGDPFDFNEDPHSCTGGLGQR